MCELKMGYCPICDINIGKRTDNNYIICSKCGHHINVVPILQFVEEDINFEKEKNK